MNFASIKHQVTLLVYLLPDNWPALVCVLLEATGFVIIGYWVAKKSTLLWQFPLTFLLGGLWVFATDFIWWSYVLKVL